MVDITHYEVYTDRGTGWKLEERFPADQRDAAIKYTREKEHDNIAVKLIREKFDVLDNNYQETIEYVSLPNKKKEAARQHSEKDNNFFTSGENFSAGGNNIFNAIDESYNSPRNIAIALAKLILIILFSLLFANIIVNLSAPLFEDFFNEEATKTLLFLFFFSLFIIVSTPLILKKIPWQVFGFRRRPKITPQAERRYFNKAEKLINLYNLNDDYQEGVVPSFPEASWEYKRYIVNYLSNLIACLDSTLSLSDDFNRLGLRLLVYGGCMQLALHSRLNIAQANSLLYEAFSIIDGSDHVDVAAFYDAKRTYKDTKEAVFLVGVGASAMSQLLSEKTLDKNFVRLAFYRWSVLNNISHRYESPKAAVLPEKEEKNTAPVHISVLLNILIRVLYNGTAKNSEEYEQEIRSSMNNIIQNLTGKYSGIPQETSLPEFIGIQFSDVGKALIFGQEFLKDADTYIDELSDENLIVAERLCLVEGQGNELPDKKNYIQDLFDHTYDGEILTDGGIYEKLGDNAPKFEFLGEKKLERTNNKAGLYRLRNV